MLRGATTEPILALRIVRQAHKAQSTAVRCVMIETSTDGESKGAGEWPKWHNRMAIGTSTYFCDWYKHGVWENRHLNEGKIPWEARTTDFTSPRVLN